MTRIDFIKRDKWRLIILMLLTASLPFMAEWENAAGAPPAAIFGCVTAMGWFGFIGMMLIPAKARKDFFNSN